MQRSGPLIFCAFLLTLLFRPAGAQAPSLLWAWDVGPYVGMGGLARDAIGNVYISEWSANKVQVFSAAGLFLREWGGTRGSDPGQLDTPLGIAIDNGGTVYVCDSENHRIQKFSTQGVYEGQWGTYGIGPGHFGVPEGIAVANNGRIYVTDFGNNLVNVFASDGTFLSSWGGTFAPGLALYNPAGITVTPANEVYVTNRGTGVVEVFTADGVFLRQWGQLGYSPEQYLQPNGIAVDGPRVFLADGTKSEVRQFTPDGTLVCSFGQGTVDLAQALLLDPGGRLFVGDANGRISVYGDLATPALGMTLGNLKARYR